MKLIKDALERGKVDQLDFSDEFEWDTKTLASAVKGYFGKQLGEPLLTFGFHEGFIEAASTLKEVFFFTALSRNHLLLPSSPSPSLSLPPPPSPSLSLLPALQKSQTMRRGLKLSEIC